MPPRPNLINKSEVFFARCNLPLFMTDGKRGETSRRIKDYSKYLSAVSAKRQPSAIRALQPLLQIPGMISLGGGMPNPDTFPFSKINVTLKSGQQLELDEKETAKALQYSPTNGLPEFVSLLKRIQLQEHRPHYEDFDICVTNGSQDALSKAFEMVVESGDNVLVETPLYSGTLAILRPMACQMVSVATDSDGVIPESLEHILSTWNVEKQGKKPKIFYTVATASNPTGITTSYERKQRIYNVARQHDLLIFEDDPYYYLQFTDARVKSYFSMDVDARVLRFDSLSKILSSGMRLGTVTGPKDLVYRIVLHSQISNLHASGISQMLAWKLIDKHWGIDGFFDHITATTELYKQRRDHIIKCMDEIIGRERATWTVPHGGMFLWIKLNQITDTKQLIQDRAMREKVICLPGIEFMPTLDSETKCQYVRAAYSVASATETTEAIGRLAKILLDTSE